MRSIGAIVFLGILAMGQHVMAFDDPASKIRYYFAAYGRTADNSQVSYDAVEKSIARFKAKSASFKDEKAFLGHVFSRTHNKFLKQYKEYATFNELFSNGTYNCLTGTALYALMLEELGFRYTIIETNYHIFLLAETSEGKILFEATDPLKGFVADDREIVKRIDGYKQNTVVQARNDKTYYQFDVKLYNAIDLDELQGLLHYNLAVEALNNGALESSIAHLDKAIEKYRSPRIEELSRILLLSVRESKLDAAKKESCIRRIQMMRRDSALAMASN
ncbi:hypothetical protein KK083_32210 [Fulvivirgaceae bacterium PWU4]|uniref:Protein SirB1 N-terminal domain-containing protein n=1 Tax=Chryseosolibacter histidini TaxID=2782349 RepID=A0AAP2DSD3_9BACT|nr:hypothetical protein [Chryseosolibacter histidini]MBT1701598.1 hypothetical protein [Chryseosolibacter histidini]